jgi:hypothetical protein
MLANTSTVDKFCTTLYVCECGYSTINKSNANKHVKTNKCSEKKISKKKVQFLIDDDKILSLIKDPEKTTIDDELETCISGESRLSDVTNESPDMIHRCSAIPGLICYVYDKSYAKRAIIEVANMQPHSEIHEYYSDMFRDPDIISIYTHDIKNIGSMVKDSMRKINIMDNDHVIHGTDSIRKFIDCVAECNISLCGQCGLR